MTGRKELLATQFAACADQPNWFVPFKQSVEGLTIEDAIRTDTQTTNFIWSIVYHLGFWNHRYLDKFNGITPVQSITDNNETFDITNIEVTDENWSKTVQDVLSSLHNWRNAILEADDTALDKKVTQDHNEAWWECIANIAIHNAYHIGQIVDIRKRQGSWKSE